MTIDDLDSLLSVKNGTLSLDVSVIPTDIWKKLLLTYNGNQPIQIREIPEGSKTKQNGVIKISGKASFQSVLNLSVEAEFRIDAQKNPQVRIGFILIGEQKLPNSWVFSQSFPKLPKFTDYSKSLLNDSSGGSFLDSLWLRNASFVLSTENFIDEKDVSISFHQGLNFRALFRPTGILGIFDSIIEGKIDEVTIFGPIILPLPTDLTPDLPPLEYPWDQEHVPPGIHLKVNLGVDAKITDSLNIKDTEFVMYCPPSEDWKKKNKTYQPSFALIGTLAVPSAKIESKITAILAQGSSNVVIDADFTGVTLGRLADLTDLVGAGDLGSNLPDQLSTATDVLKDLALESVGIALQGSLNANAVSYVSAKIGFPGKTWKAVPGVIEFSDFSVLFILTSPFSSGQRNVSSIMEAKIEFCGVELDVTTYMPGFSIRAELEGEANIPLSRLFSQYLPELPSPPDLSIDRFILGATPGKSYSIFAVIGEDKPWVLDLGPTSMTISDIEVDFEKQIGGQATGSFSGIIQFSDTIELDIRYDIPGQFIIRTEIDTIHLSALIERLCNQFVDLPDSFDLTLKQSSVMISKSGNDLAFLFATRVDSFGSFAFEARKVAGGKWGYALGLDLGTGAASSLPSLGPISIFEDFFHLQKLLFVVSSFDSPDFTFPDMAAFENPRIGAKKLTLPVQSGGIITGLNIYGEWTLDKGDKQQSLLSGLLGLNPVLGITLQLGSNPRTNSRLYVDFSTKIQGHPLICKFGGQIQNGSIGLFLTGTMTVDIQGHPQNFDITLLFVENGAFISATMKGNTSVNFSVFKLSNLALEIGINWEGIPSLGVAATIDVGEIESSVAVFFDSAEPSKSMVAGSISDLTLKTVIDTLTGNVIPSGIDDVLDKVAIKGTGNFTIPVDLASDLDNLKLDRVASSFLSQGKISIPSSLNQTLLVVNSPGSIWYLTDLVAMKHYQLRKSNTSINVSLEAQFYCAPQNTFIGTLQFPAGFYINGAVEFFSFEASVRITINPNQGIAADAQMDPIIIGNESIFSIQAADGNGGPRISIATYSQPEQKEEKFRPPHFYINGKYELLGLKNSAFIEVTKSGLILNIEGTLAPAVSFDLHASIGGPSLLDVGGSAKVDIGTIDTSPLPLGKIHIDTGVEAGIDIKVADPKIIATLEASFEFLGDSHNIAKFNLDPDTGPLVKLVDILEDKVKDILEDLFSDPLKWVEAFGQGLIDGITDPEKILTGHFGLPFDQAKDMLKDVGGIVKTCATTTAASLF